MNTIEKFNENVMQTYGRYPVVAQQGENCVCTDENGKKYIDFGSGIGTNSLGYCNEKWAEAVCNQAKTKASITSCVGGSESWMRTSTRVKPMLYSARI